ncbi:MAG: AAA family ATPase, partial [Hyphomicrobiales bacterium]|nr:AAA family ATPase [Hyphomicrobiales bacterium]
MNKGTSEDQKASTHKRLADLVDYVEHMAKLGERAAFALSEYHQLTYHETELKDRVGISHDQSDEDGPIWLSIDRLKRIAPPQVPEEISSWITVAADPFSEPVVEKVRTETMSRARANELVEQGVLEADDVQPALQTGGDEVGEVNEGPCDVIVRLTNLPDIEASIQAYVGRTWREWAETERPRRETIKIYDDFFSLQQTLQSMDGERGLEVVWGMGMARWGLEDGRRIDHPIVEQLVEIEVDTVSGRLAIRPRSAEPAAPLKPFFEIECPSVDQVHTFAKAFLNGLPEEQDLSPFVGETFEPVLRQASSHLHGEARYHPDDLDDITDRSLPPVDGTLRVTNTWAVFARQRSDNFFINDLERLKNSVEESEELPGPARRLVTEPSDTPTRPGTFIDIGSGSANGGGATPPLPDQDDIEASRPEEFFFPKPFNDDQISIIRRLKEADGVVVQGPPGTGKTHTIANIICHYLATGQRVLVTSKGEAALTVLRDHIPESIRDLTISLLTNEREGLKQLEQAVGVLANTASQMQPRRLKQSIESGQQRVATLRANVDKIEHELGQWAQLHHKEIGAGTGILPMDLARRLVADGANHIWFTDRPGPQKEYAPQFNDQDIARLREARQVLGANLQYLGKALPSLSDLPDGATVAAIHEDLVNAGRLEAEAAEHGIPALSLSAPDAVLRANKLDKAIQRVVRMFVDFDTEPWLARIFEIWRDQGLSAEEVGLFSRLLPDITDTARRRQDVLGYAVTLPEGAERSDDLLEAAQRAASGDRPFGWMAMGKSEARALYAEIRIESREPSRPDDWTKIAEALTWRRNVMALASRWVAIADEYALPPLDQNLDRLGRRLSAIIAMVDRISGVLQNDRRLIEADLPELFPSGLSASQILASKNSAEKAAAIIQINLSKSRLRGSRDRISSWLEVLAGCSGPIIDEITGFLSASIGNTDLTQAQVTDAWQGLCGRLTGLHELRPHLQAVERIAQAVADSGAPNWANALRTEPVSEAQDIWTPATWNDSWTWARQEAYLDRIDGRDRIRTLANDLLQHEDDLRKTF